MRTVKLATWNLGFAFGSFRKTHAEAWEYLRDKIRPDIALLQEVKIPELRVDEDVVFRPVHRDWGTAIYARALSLQELAIQRYPGRVAVANVRIHDRELALASVHAPVIKNEVHPHLDFIFDDIERLFKDRSGIVGGDLNSARLCEEAWPDRGHGPFFQRIERGPFVDCHWKFHRKEIQTFFRKNTRWCFQDDHIFASPDMAKCFTSCAVLDNKTTRRLSDHIPIIAEVDIGQKMPPEKPPKQVVALGGAPA
jgi:endonuclease/exonuclease/phosphatase family metal-dependent hydrolase